MSEVLVSFIVPTLNRLEYLKDTLTSINNQTINNYEVIICENNCTDGTKEWLSQQQNINIISNNEIVPMYNNWNYGIRFAKGKYFMIISDDDLVSNNIVEEIVLVDKKYSKLGMIMFNHKVIDEENIVLDSYISPYLGLYKQGIEAFKCFEKCVDNRLSGIAFNRKLVLELGGFDEKYKWTAADSKLIQQMSVIADVYFVNNKINIPSYRVWKNSFTNVKLLTYEWHEQVIMWCNEMEKFTKEKINYDFSKNSQKIISSNFLWAIRHNLEEKNIELIVELLKKYPKKLKNTKIYLIKFISKNKLLFKILCKFNDNILNK